MSVIRYREAVRAAMIEEMDRDPNVYLMGEEVGHYQGAYKVTEGMLERFGTRRVIDTPITESGFTGVSIGAAMVGLRPIVEYMTWNFSAVAFDQILNNAAKIRQMSGGQLHVPIVLRAPNGSARQVGSQHSHAMEHFYAHIPGLKVLAPAMPADAKGLLKSAIRDDDPVLFMESETLYNVKGEVPDDPEVLVPIGKASVAREGKDVTIVSWSRIVHVALEAAKTLAEQGIEAEIIDLRSLRPLDEETIAASVRKTHRAVVAHEGWPYGGVGAEIVDRIQRLAFDDLDAPVLRVTTLDFPMPYNAALELYVVPSAARIVEKVREVAYAGGVPGQAEVSAMSKVLEMPKLSPTMEEGQISVWHKKPGDAVAVDDLLAEVETDKATMEFRSFDKGVLLEILAPAGTVVKLGQPVAVLGAPGDTVGAAKQEGAKEGAPEAPKKAPAAEDAPKKEPAAAKPEEPTAPAAAKEKPEAPPAEPAKPEPAAEPAPSDGRVKASPYVRKLARERGLHLDAVAGTGPNGRIIARDLESLAQGAPAAAPEGAPTSAKPAAPAPASGDLAAPESRPLSMMRKAIARRLTESKQTVPHFYLTIDVDADPLHHLREQINQDLAANAGSDQAPKVSFNDLLVKACAIALVRVPECNAQFTPEAILIHKRVDISVAVAVAEGLITPVVRGADKKSVLAISAEVRELAGRAKAKKLKPEEMANGTFSISNLGMYGIDAFAAVINPPEGAILAVGQVRREPVVKGEEVVPGRRLALTLSCDHRVVDGAVGATFLRALRQLCEHPTQILL